MAKRRKRKHRPSDKYIQLVKKLQSKSIIPTITPKAKTSRIESKQIRDSIRRAYSEQRKVTFETPKSTYNGSKKKNRREARQKRKQKKQKAKQLQQQRQIQQDITEPEQIPTLDYGERDEDFRSEDGKLDDTTNYIEDLISTVQYVNDTLKQMYADWSIYVDFMFTLDQVQFWLEEALQLPYDIKVEICDMLSQNKYLDKIEDLLHLEHYKEIEASVESISQQISQIIESAY